MVYINENSKIVSFPKSSNAKWDKVHFVNQTTHVAFDLFATDTTNNDLVYNIDISSVIDKFEAGQYDYSFQKNNGTVICSGIIQFDSFTPNTLQYTHNTEYIQYTPEETYYPEATSTIYITENDTYNVEDYNTAVVNVVGNVAGGGELNITNIYNSSYKPLIQHYDIGEGEQSYNTSNRLYADIIFNLNCDGKTLYACKDTTYVTLSRYAKSRYKHTVFNDVKQSDKRLKMYCWVVTNDEINPVYWSYFYTTEDFNNDVNEMWDNCYDGSYVWVSRLPFAEERCYGSLGWENNYITSINQLVITDEWLEDYWTKWDIQRYPEGDVDSYYVNALSENPIRKWLNEWWDGDEPDSFIEENKEDFILWVTSKSFGIRGFNPDKEVDLYAYKTYCGDYPITPIKLADCEVQIWGDLAEKYFDDVRDEWIKLSNLEDDDIKELKQIVFRLPYNTNEIIARLYTDTQNRDFIYRDWSKYIYVEQLNTSNRVGAIKRVSGVWASERGALMIPLRLGLCSEEQIKSGNYKDIPEYKFTLISKGGKWSNRFDEYNGTVRETVLTKLKY